MAVPYFGEVVTITRLLIKLQQDFSEAPEQGRALASDLVLLHNCIATLEGSIPRYKAADGSRLQFVLKPVLQLLGEIDEVSERYSNLNSGRRIWDRLTFPKVKIQALQKQIHLRVSAINLFMHSLSNNSLIRIEEILEEIGNIPNRQFSNANGWENILVDLQRRGIDRESALQLQGPIEQHLEALSQVEEAESQLEIYENTIVPEDALDQDIVVGPPTEAHLASLVCPGASAIQKGKTDAIRQNRSILLRHFGGSKYELICRHCQFHGFQDEPLKNKERPVNTPLFFCPRQEAPKPDSMEYYLDIHRANRPKRDGIWYRTIFFWKCHIKTQEPLLHTSARYECVFCPPETAYGNNYSKDSLLEHIRRHHIQTPPSQELRIKYNVWVDNRQALFFKDQERLKALDFDIMLPRACGRTDRMRAEHAMRQAQAQGEGEISTKAVEGSDSRSIGSSETAGTHQFDESWQRDIARTSTEPILQRRHSDQGERDQDGSTVRLSQDLNYDDFFNPDALPIHPPRDTTTRRDFQPSSSSTAASSSTTLFPAASSGPKKDNDRSTPRRTFDGKPAALQESRNNLTKQESSTSRTQRATQKVIATSTPLETSQDRGKTQQGHKASPSEASPSSNTNPEEASTTISDAALAKYLQEEENRREEARRARARKRREDDEVRKAKSSGNLLDATTKGSLAPLNVNKKDRKLEGSRSSGNMRA